MFRDTHHDEDSWEGVLLQIALGMLVILGYLLSNSNERLRVSERQRVLNEVALKRYAGTTTEQLADEVARLEAEVQRLRLLSEWRKLRIERDLFRLLLRVGEAENVALNVAKPFLPSPASRYAELGTEGARVFGSPPSLKKEMSSLVTRVCERAGVDLHSYDPAVHIPSILFNATDVHRESLEALHHEIRQDLASERTALASLQDGILMKVCTRRLEKVTGEELASYPEDPRELQQVLAAEVSQHLALLPEVLGSQ